MDITPYLYKKYKMTSYKKGLIGVYTIRNIKNGKVYVGSSINIKRRWCKHKNYLRGNSHKNVQLQLSWIKYKEDMFQFSIQEFCSKEDLLIREGFWVDFYESINSNKGYNVQHPLTSKLSRTKLPRKNDSLVKYVSINTGTGEISHATSLELIRLYPRIKIHKLISYWRGKKESLKTHKDIMLVHPKDYDPSFDYLGYDKTKLYWESYTPKPPKPYVSQKKAPEDIIPYSKRNIVRVPVMLKHKDTGEELFFSSLSEAKSKLGLISSKVDLCVSKPFMQRSHRGYYFKRLV